MAKTKSAEPSAPTTTLADQIKKCRQGLIDDWNRLDGENPDDIDGLTTALMYFQNYPILKETMVDSVRQRSNGEHQILQGLAVLQQQLNFTHEAAVMFLIQKCESMGIDSAAISMSGDYCRVLLNDRQHKFGAYRGERGVDTWPDCLSVEVLDIPADIREAVQAGKATLLKLVARIASMPERANPSPAVTASSTDQDRMKFFVECKTKNPRATQKNIAELWQKDRNEPCDEGSFKQSLWRVRQAAKK